MRAQLQFFAFALCCASVGLGCGSGSPMQDAAVDAGVDTGTIDDAGAVAGDLGPTDASQDAAAPTDDLGLSDASQDAAAPTDDLGVCDPPAPPCAEPAGLCEHCAIDEQCPEEADCVVFGQQRLCLLRTEGEFSSCPRTFEAYELPAYPGTLYCLPTEGCCLDEDGDSHGQGVFCDGTDCNDDEPLVHPGAAELCNGEDDDCDEVEDNVVVDCEPAAQCLGGLCVPDQA